MRPHRSACANFPHVRVRVRVPCTGKVSPPPALERLRWRRIFFPDTNQAPGVCPAGNSVGSFARRVYAQHLRQPVTVHGARKLDARQIAFQLRARTHTHTLARRHTARFQMRIRAPRAHSTSAAARSADDINIFGMAHWHARAHRRSGDARYKSETCAHSRSRSRRCSRGCLQMGAMRSAS